eukprot:2403595-Amphidinium_carterae.1
MSQSLCACAWKGLGYDAQPYNRPIQLDKVLTDWARHFCRQSPARKSICFKPFLILLNVLVSDPKSQSSASAPYVKILYLAL